MASYLSPPELSKKLTHGWDSLALCLVAKLAMCLFKMDVFEWMLGQSKAELEALTLQSKKLIVRYLHYSVIWYKIGNFLRRHYEFLTGLIFEDYPFILNFKNLCIYLKCFYKSCTSENISFLKNQL